MAQTKHEDSRSLDDLDQTLKAIWLYAFTKFREEYPNDSEPIITQTYRSPETQNKLFAQGRTTGKKGITVTDAKGGQSAHNVYPSLAFDIAFKKSEKQLDWSEELFEKFAKIILDKFADKVTWGKTFPKPDRPHFQLKNWKTLKTK